MIGRRRWVSKHTRDDFTVVSAFTGVFFLLVFGFILFVVLTGA